jgi:ribosome-associated toxin RatA of RatAB toxin-antitoxin module
MTTPHEFHLAETVTVDAPAETVYDLVSDVTRTGERSPECRAARWTSGAPGTVGARFQGTNQRGEREWTTECEVVAAERPRRFAFAVVTSTPDAESSVWTYEVEPDGDRCRVTERYDMTRPPAPLQKRIDERTPEQVDALLDAWGEHLRTSIRTTLDALRESAERFARTA